MKQVFFKMKEFLKDAEKRKNLDEKGKPVAEEKKEKQGKKDVKYM